MSEAIAHQTGRGMVGRYRAFRGRRSSRDVGQFIVFLLLASTLYHFYHNAPTGSSRNTPVRARALVTLVRVCDIWSFELNGKAVVARRGRIGEVFKSSASDERSTAILLPGDRVGWVKNSCIGAPVRENSGASLERPVPNDSMTDRPIESKDRSSLWGVILALLILLLLVRLLNRRRTHRLKPEAEPMMVIEVQEPPRRAEDQASSHSIYRRAALQLLPEFNWRINAAFADRLTLLEDSLGIPTPDQTSVRVDCFASMLEQMFHGHIITSPQDAEVLVRALQHLQISYEDVIAQKFQLMRQLNRLILLVEMEQSAREARLNIKKQRGDGGTTSKEAMMVPKRGTKKGDSVHNYAQYRRAALMLLPEFGWRINEDFVMKIRQLEQDWRIPFPATTAVRAECVKAMMEQAAGSDSSLSDTDKLVFVSALQLLELTPEDVPWVKANLI